MEKPEKRLGNLKTALLVLGGALGGAGGVLVTDGVIHLLRQKGELSD